MLVRAAIVILVAMGAATATAFAEPASPVSTPIASPPVADYAEVSGPYSSVAERLRSLGQPAIQALLDGDIESLTSNFTPEMNQAVSPDDLAQLSPDLTTNRVHFELPEVNAIFDGHLDDDTIEGFLTQGATSSFHLERNDSSSEANAETGSWTGAIEVPGNPIKINVNLAKQNDELSGTISIPGEGAVDLPLAAVSFDEERPIGAMEDESVLPLQPDNAAYSAQYRWGDAFLTISTGFDSSNQINALQIAPNWPLPPDPAADYESQTSFALPFEGVWWVFWGGNSQFRNYHVTAPMQRHAYDIVVWKDGGTARADGSTNEDYWAWGQPIYAPAGGKVVSVVDGIADNVPGQMNPSQPTGNHVVIETAAGEYLFLAHFQNGTIAVTEGQELTGGELVGLTGNSGNSSEPHLHIHLQDKPGLFDAGVTGLPLEFTNYQANGTFVDQGIPVQGQFIERNND